MTAIWFWIVICFYIFSHYLNEHSTKIHFFSDASYTVYLFHHVLVMAFGILLINLGVGGFTGMIILAAAAMAVSLLFHVFFVAKWKIMRFMFNGKYA